MTNCSNIVGHELQRQQFAKLLSEERLPHACLFSGLSGIGKRLIAYELAKTLFCQKAKALRDSADAHILEQLYGGCGECSQCRIVDLGNQPDLIQVECSDKEQIKVENIRKLLYTLNLRSFGGGARMVIFNDAELLTIQASNTLLKSLEEPRAETYFVLVTSNPSALPITVRSRCQTWHFEELSAGQIEEILTNSPEILGADLTQAKRSSLSLLADGSLENVSMVAQNLDTWSKLEEALLRVAKGDLCFALELAEQFAKDKQNLESVIRLIRIFSRHQMKSEKSIERKTLWANLLRDTISAEYLIFTRNISAQYVLNSLLSRAAPDQLDERTVLYPFAHKSLSDLVVR